MKTLPCLAVILAAVACQNDGDSPGGMPREDAATMAPMDAAIADTGPGANPIDAATDAASSDHDAGSDAASEDDSGAPTPSLPCSVEIEDPQLPGVRLRVEGDRCRVRTATEHEFRYSLEIDAAIAYTAPDSGGSCGRCGGYGSDPRALVDSSIGAGDVWYCVCDVGCCPPTTWSAQMLEAGVFTGAIVWPGREWNGPSDTDEPLGPPFPAGDYDVSVTFAVPGIGSMTARLPIEVFGDAAVSGEASCEVDGQVHASGATGIGDPQSCNTCTCDDGTLVCTEINCPEPCPSGTAYGTSCSQCGPTDACEVVRHACLPTCAMSSDCEDLTDLWFCGAGVCRNVCG